MATTTAQKYQQCKGIGKRATAMLIIFTQGFRNTKNHRQLISYAGLSPTEYSSGSIKGSGRIYKKGGRPCVMCYTCVP
jgi:transposase